MYGYMMYNYLHPQMDIQNTLKNKLWKIYVDFEISNLCPSVSNTDCFTGNTQKGVKHRSSYGYLVYLPPQNSEYVSVI